MFTSPAVHTLSETTAIRLYNSVTVGSDHRTPVPPIRPQIEALEQKSIESIQSCNEFGNSCRICRWNRSDMQILQCPCHCKGSVGHVHLQCLKRWIMHRRDNHCEICKEIFNLPDEKISIKRMINTFCTRCLGAIIKHILFSASLIPLAHVVLHQVLFCMENINQSPNEQLSVSEVLVASCALLTSILCSIAFGTMATMAQLTSARSGNRETLYGRCLCCFVTNLNYNQCNLSRVQYLRYLPPGVLIDIYVMMSHRDDLKDMLFEQLADLEIFERLLRFDPSRQKLFCCLATLMGKGKPLATQLQQNFTLRFKQKERHTLKTASKLATLAKAKLALVTACSSFNSNKWGDRKYNQCDDDLLRQADSTAFDDDKQNGVDVIDFGLRLGSFLSEAGWLSQSIEILSCVSLKLKTIELDPKLKIIQVDCLQRLLHSEAALSNFKSAERTFNKLTNLLTDIAAESIPKPLLANTYTQFSEMYFARNEYDYSHMWSAMAIQNLEESTPERITIDVLRQAAKACVVKRDFQRANMLICQAKQRAKNVFGCKHQKYADTLLDYGFFLLNVDCAYQSVNVYIEALDIKRYIFGNRNFHVALAHEDLSYAYYVHEYSTGNFTCARDHVEKAVDIMQDLVPSDHLRLASAKRVKALLLEEIALNKMAEGADDEGLLKQSEDLHKFALQLSLEVFGEEAERMHQKAIEIKTDLLGPYDYEVGLSIGHLASLYNYQMKKYREAEELYLRSIQISKFVEVKYRTFQSTAVTFTFIGLRVFGSSYSGLEYDYLGLCHVYETLREYEKYLMYAHILENWQILRSQNLTMNKSIYPAISEECSLEEIKWQFFNAQS
uniref:RING-CH-type domain-containing protein n=1 Tax=Glossina palpalis gambiensis TaxID=67801 RepID=A0A1B0B774_9MUSC